MAPLSRQAYLGSWAAQGMPGLHRRSHSGRLPAAHHVRTRGGVGHGSAATSGGSRRQELLGGGVGRRAMSCRCIRPHGVPTARIGSTEHGSGSSQGELCWPPWKAPPPPPVSARCLEHPRLPCHRRKPQALPKGGPVEARGAAGA
ncbi:UNVERIFIED_CONTAM: hypothetical protein K2H54_002945 [Gekko kuhli]